MRNFHDHWYISERLNINQSFYQKNINQSLAEIYEDICVHYISNDHDNGSTATCFIYLLYQTTLFIN